MKVYREKFELVLPPSLGRSVGLHCSEVIKDLGLATGVLDKKWGPSKDTDSGEEYTEKRSGRSTNMMQIGLAWEDYLARYQHPEIEFHPGELMRESCSCGVDHDLDHHSYNGCEVAGCGCKAYDPIRIYMSPDGVRWEDDDDLLTSIGFDRQTWCLHEFKFTRKSSRDFTATLRLNGKKARMWRWQIMAYAYAMKTELAKLHVMFANGDYSFDGEEGSPDYQVFRLVMTEDEIKRNWTMLFNHAVVMVAKRRLAA